ncbi:MAG: hypothetical protein CVT68_05940 [Actinobacteria bacterium HGW-Actinobacteria-8]|nr:MAG: hypothetical protein CVT68_05940 [Actinobacteria bacterium HGW-Actinobacteria-8]
MKTDLKKTIPSYAAKSGRFDIIDIPPMRYLAIDAEGAPEGENFAEALSVLFPLAYAVKFGSRAHLGYDYVVPPLEALWWADDMSAFTTAYDRSAWRSTALSLLPDWVTDDVLDAAREKVAEKLPRALVERVRAEVMHEGVCGQTLHVGSFDTEGPTIQALHRALVDAGMTLSGKHHEIYLSDMRRVVPATLNTIVRQGGTPAT